MGMRCCSKIRSTPACAMPRAKPPPNAKPIRSGAAVEAMRPLLAIRRRIDGDGPAWSGSCSAKKSLIFNFRLPAPVGLFLASNAKRGPRHSLEPLQANLFVTVKTRSIATVGNPPERGTHLPQGARLALEVSSRQFARSRELHFIQRIGRAFDGKTVSPSQRSRRFGVLRIQDSSKIVKFSTGHSHAPFETSEMRRC